MGAAGYCTSGDSPGFITLNGTISRAQLDTALASSAKSDSLQEHITFPASGTGAIAPGQDVNVFMVGLTADGTSLGTATKVTLPADPGEAGS
ncbi:unnamed protein product [Protopolystoma xenopodis]|uniref:Uncharacterized protein n=1 Tax=Protopolystoma xenopodis TaxID=117903 RepID=A0A448XGH4_9PLAT|nr:unnamed protein product [Protopolystoma xenopodis]